MQQRLTLRLLLSKAVIREYLGIGCSKDKAAVAFLFLIFPFPAFAEFA